MKKIKKIYIMTLFTLIISVFNITIINAEVKPGKGFKLYYTDLLGSQVGDVKYVLKASDAGFPYASIILSGLPSFTSSNAISVANQYFANDTNLKNVISSIGLIPYDTAKLKNYTLNIQGIYGSSKNEYRYTYATTVSSSYEIVCNRGACAKKRENGICTSGYNYSCSDGRNRVYRSADKQITDTVGSSSTTNTTTAWGVPKPILKDNQKLIKTEEQTVSDYSYKSITSLVFDRTNIEQAELCGEKSIYEDKVKIEDALGSQYYLDASLGNSKYCPVYCVEENIFAWPGFKPTAQMGGHFTWTIGKNINENILSGLTVKLSGKRDCRTKIDLEQWQKDYNDVVSKITEEQKTLKTGPTNKKFCPPNLGSRGCGYKFIKEGHRDGFGKSVPKIFRYPLGTNGNKLSVNESFGVLDSNKFVTIYTLNPGSAWESTGQEDIAAPLVGTYWIEDWRELKTLCPCEWRKEKATSTEETVGIELNVGDNITFLDYTKACGDVKKYPKYPEVTENTTIESLAPIATKKNCSGNGSCDENFMGVHVSTSTAQTVISKVSCSQKIITHVTSAPVYATKCKCSNPSITSEPLCEMSGWNWDCDKTITNYKNEYKYEYEFKVARIEQELCIGDGNISDYTQECLDLGPVCPSGYHFGIGGSCYKTDTSYLEKLLDQQQTLLDILGECTKISLDYKLDTEMAVDFEEPTYGRVSKLDKNKTLSTSKENFKEYGQGISQSTGGVCTITSADGDCRKIETYKVCNLKELKRYCWNETKDITAIWIKQYGKEFNVGYDYKLPSEFYRYVLIPSGKSVDNTTPSTNKLGKYQNYINVGFANYPVHYSTPTGLYQLDINYKTVGYKDHFTQYIENKIDKNTNIITYDCEYDVKDEEVIRCEEEDGCIDVDDEKELGNVRLIYRPISLVNPFPAINGSGRKTGSNWCNDKDCSKDNAIVSKYILNNRNVNYDANDYDGSNVYTKREPMYTVVLNPAVIKQIREYNKNNTYDDFNLYCSDGHKCQSEFIKEKFQGLFTGCGASNDFDYCDTEDGYRR